MKNNKIIFGLLIGIIGISVFIICNKGSDKVTLDQIKEDANVNRKQFAMYVQDESNPENYREYTDNGNMFPDGYTLNVERSECQDYNGIAVPTNGVISQTSDGKVMVTSTKTVYCTFYFDMKPMPKLVDTIKEMNTTDVTTLGSSASNNDGYLIYHDGTGTYGTYEAGDKSYRFSGNNPDNYVCLDGNISTSTCSAGKLYRVIGIYPTDTSATTYTTKLIKSEYMTAEELGGGLKSSRVSQSSNSDFTKRVENSTSAVGFYWSGESSINYNNWKKSTLNTTLNNPSGEYLKSLSAYTDLIDDTTWYIGGNTYKNIIYQTSMKEAYENELGANKLKEGSTGCVDESEQTTQCTNELLYEENKKVGLMYATEYGYASAPRNWSSRLVDYDNANNRGENWLYNGVYEWTLSRHADSAGSSFYVDGRGLVYDGSGSVTSLRSGVRPVLVLKSNATVKNGSGSKNSPWRINLQSS